jgi:hypothetical protein
MYVHTYHTRYFGESDAVASQLQSPVLAISACVLGQKSNGFGEKYHVLGSMAWVSCRSGVDSYWVEDMRSEIASLRRIALATAYG